MGEPVLYAKYETKEGSAHLDTGYVLWSDIVEFRALGFQIGPRIGRDPVGVREMLMEDVSQSFRQAEALNANFSDRVGADGWYHFYHSPAGPLDLAVSTQEQLENVISANPSYAQTELKVVMGAHKTGACHISDGGPAANSNVFSRMLWSIVNVLLTKVLSYGLGRGPTK